MKYNILNRIEKSYDVSRLNEDKLDKLCEETRHFLIDKVSKTGGHLSANLGTIEIVTAMHYSFSTPIDEFVFDVGHQCYTHKLYTGRQSEFDNLRKLGGLSGFPAPSESDSDIFIAGHGSTSISVAIGLATAKKLKNETGYVVALIGDGAFTGGMVYEGLNNIDKNLDNLIIILNDNKMSISKNVGAVSRYLSNIRTNKEYLDVKQGVSNTLDKIPVIGSTLSKTITASKTIIRRSVYNSTFFEDLGLIYHKVEDGNNVHVMCAALEAAKRCSAPVLIHALTVKGKGFTPAELNPGAFHGVGVFDKDNVPDPDVAPADSYSTIFGKNLSEMANKNDKICAITAAMKYGTGLQFFYKDHRRRFFDVGMAEEHAVTFAAGLAKSGLHPIVCLYSTFMQRSLDQFLHDVALLKLNVMFAIDRAGLVPGDGETHQGIFDISIFNNYEDTPIACPSNYEELLYWQEYLINNVNGPKVLRYPRGGQDSITADYKCTGNAYDLIKSSHSSDTLLIGYGKHFGECLKAVKALNDEYNIKVDLLKLNLVNPFNSDLVSSVKDYKKIYFFEEHNENGGVAQKLGFKLLTSSFDGKYVAKNIPNYSATHATVPQLWEICKLDVNSIITTIKDDI